MSTSLASNTLDAESVRIWETPVRALNNAISAASSADPAVAAAVAALNADAMFQSLMYAESEEDFAATVETLKLNPTLMALLDLVTSALINRLS